MTMRCADLRGADLRDAENAQLAIAQMMVAPPEGEIIGWKKCQDNLLVKLRIPAHAKRSNTTTRNCRADRAEVLAIYTNKTPGAEWVEWKGEARSQHNPSFTYRTGQVVTVPDFDENRWNECAPGIHFFITREEAEAW